MTTRSGRADRTRRTKSTSATQSVPKKDSRVASHQDVGRRAAHASAQIGDVGSDFPAATLCRGVSWPLLNTIALEEAHASVPLGHSWCLMSFAGKKMSLDDCSRQHAIVAEELGTNCTSCEATPVQTMIAYYDVGDLRPRFEPWLFAASPVRRDLVAWLCSRFRRPVAFWGTGDSLWALTPDKDHGRNPWGASARQIGSFRPGAIAHAICESSPEFAGFLSFDAPASTFAEAVRRAALIGDAR